ncbi:urea ABC transporter permease subunit UrtB [Rhizobium sp. CFBP 8762]|uniref:urea ABC transporter permease subunit UrtB n=1 Tax=Rhizobium sp. CFBP 8762 TaxID=2775279 RepID=UPI00177C7A78|nr:urea ABC transporter permease subunit UrtB [Rhizobium sp. CFBP 8762]MBD8554088.1 urea ABC transporter permease subunit UrtB [Rhizobium sp. CFBP 8762]
MTIRTAILTLCLLLQAAFAQAQTDLRSSVDALGQGKFADVEAAITVLAKTGDPKAVPVLEALAAGDLYTRKSDARVFMTRAAGDDVILIDPITGVEDATAPKASVQKIRVNNTVRRAVRTALGGLTLLSPERQTRLAAAQSVLMAPSGEVLDLVETALATEKDADVRRVMEEARAASLLKSDRSTDEKKQAIETIRQRGDRDALGILSSALGSVDETLRPDVERAIAGIEERQALWNAGQNVWYGISLGSVLLLAAIGLAVTFGVMGIINMAHGEMVMLGAYTTFVVQDVIRTRYPDMFEWSLAIALPLAFLFTAFIGLVIERGVIRFLYGRPLETLLATWGLSLILQQAVRSLFGPTNREVGNPTWMSGAFELGGLTITWNRLWIVVFSLSVFLALLAVLKRSSFGLQMRAVTQNRRMASSMGIRTPYVDAATFALGSGIAGMAGVALSQIDNVSPNLGQSYIIDSFMVVVFGGVGNLWGTLVGAFSLGILNKFLEPYAGAVLGKIFVLVLIILFIQKRPRGLFALKGRAVDA